MGSHPGGLETRPPALGPSVALLELALFSARGVLEEPACDARGVYGWSQGLNAPPRSYDVPPYCRSCMKLGGIPGADIREGIIWEVRAAQHAAVWGWLSALYGTIDSTSCGGDSAPILLPVFGTR